MRLNELHPLDRRRARDLGELLCAWADGESVTRRALLSLVTELMVFTSPHTSADGADQIVDRLLVMADARSGAEAMTDAALIEIATERGRR